MKSLTLLIRPGIFVAFIVVTSMSAEAQEAPENISFGEQIRPIFTEHCTACHGGVKQAGDLSFVYRHQVLPPDGWVVEPGKPEESVLLERVTSDDPELRMPPPDHGKALSKQDVALLTEWIRQGAPWDEHWALTAPILPSEPELQDRDWARKPLDAFVLSKLEKLNLQPAPDADPERWLRRVSLDLVGLPPTLEERADFLKDLGQSHTAPDSESAHTRKSSAETEAAYEKVVDRLLMSPHFGERWATVWLDQIRYADSKGLGLDGKRNIWKYRDWVIDAFNRDLPYDQFTIRQIAGDLLPNASIEDLIATAAHRVTQTNEEGGTDDEEFRVAAVLDRVNTTWQAWQGLTFGCAQCHNHPYDPIQHSEYYKFAAFFNNTKDCDLDQDWPIVQAPIDPSKYAEASELDQQIGSLRDAIWQQEFRALQESSFWKPLKGLKASSNNATQLAVEPQGGHDEFHTVGTVSRDADLTLEAPLPPGIRRLTAIRFTGMPLEPEKAVSDSEWGFVLSQFEAAVVVPNEKATKAIEFERVVIDEPNPFYDPQESLNPKSNSGFAAYTRINYPRQAAFILQSPMDVPEGASIRVTLKHRVFILAAFSLIARRGHLAVSDAPEFTALLTNADLKEQRRQLAILEKQRGGIPSTSVPVLAERPKSLVRPMHVFDRGLFLTKGKEVKAATPESFPPLSADKPVDRLTLAYWMASPQNPLTARVAVNRVWARMFGVGIVATEEDFGSSGEAPSHPRLLDSLAIRFQGDYEWRLKSVVREIALSRTYRQSSAIRPELQERDAQNRLLARGPRQRLSAELIRDQALAISGLLSHKQFGPPVHPPIPDGVWMPFSGGDKWVTPEP
ncbi:MAG: PSD1 domain-containing protein, partial [Planctomycetaceae bacterium]|nr:PSD1 domain-containing protein [Planctomycetaceae bacterium]